MATYKIIGARYLRKYTEPSTSPVYAAATQAQRIVDTLCDVPWERVSAKDAAMTYHTDEIVDEESKVKGLDMNVAVRDRFDAALFCAGHVGGQHRAYANAACYRYVLPDGAVGRSLTSLAVRVTSDPYNAAGARIHVLTNSTGEIPTSCHDCRGENSSGQVVDDGTTESGVAPRTATTTSGQTYWYPTTATATLEPTGGLTLQKYLFVFVLLESYSTVRGNWLEGCSYIENKIAMTTSAAVTGWEDGATIDLSAAEDDATIAFPVTRHGTTQSNFGAVSGLCGISVLANGDGFDALAAEDVDGHRRYSLTQAQVDRYSSVPTDTSDNYYIGLRSLYARFYAGDMETAEYQPGDGLRCGAGFSVSPATFVINDTSLGPTLLRGWSLAAASIAIPFSAPAGFSAWRISVSWGADGNPTGGTVNGGTYNFWLKRGVYVDALPESLLKNPDIYVGSKGKVDGWEFLGRCSGGSAEFALSDPLEDRVATVLVTAFVDQAASFSAGATGLTFSPKGASTELTVMPAATRELTSDTRGVASFGAAGVDSLVRPDITLHGVSETYTDESWNEGEVVFPHGPLCFTAEEPGSTVALSAGTNAPSVSLRHSTNGTTWSDYSVGTTITLANAGDKVYFVAGPGGNPKMSSTWRSDTGTNKFIMTGKIAASGDVTSLLSPSGSVPDLLGRNCDEGGSAGCLAYLFHDCTSLTAAPELPSTTLDYACYSHMFSGCTALTIAPELPATTLAVRCYNNMFSGCTALTVAPELPATTLDIGCYYAMFFGCTALTVAPELPATTLPPVGSICYSQMFSGCTSLNEITVRFTAWSWSDDNHYGVTDYWMDNVSASGTFKCPTALGTQDTITRDSNHCPAGWTVVNI